MSKKTIMLKSSDGDSFEVDEAVALQSKTIANIIEDNCAGDVIPIPNVKRRILKLLMEYCKMHVESDDSLTKESKVDLNKWDAEFIKMKQSTLFLVMEAANYLYIKDLLALSCRTVADIIKGKTPEEIRTLFNIKKDLTEEEEEAIVNENHWAFDD